MKINPMSEEKKRRRNFTREMRRAARKQDYIKVMLLIILHYFSDVSEWANKMDDPRHKSYVKYNQAHYFWLGIFKNLCNCESIRDVVNDFNEDTCIQLINILSGNDVGEIPHGKSLNWYLSQLPPSELEEIRTQIIRRLIRSKVFNSSRLLGTYWRVILDGTGLFYFKEKHCEHCLFENHKNKDGTYTKRYYHKVLELKLVLHDKIVISLGTEFIENENQDVKKQECELKAAKKLLPRVKKMFPRLPICLQGDNLYCVESIMEMCSSAPKKSGKRRCKKQNKKNQEENKDEIHLDWRYIFTHKNSRQKVVGEAYESMPDDEPGIYSENDLTRGKTVISNAGPEQGTAKYRNGIDEFAGKDHTFNIFEYSYSEETEDGDIKNTRFMWATDIVVNVKNVKEMVRVARGRWKIENEGFNTQKNHLYHIQHINSRNCNAMKCHYLLTQIADIIMQLFLSYQIMITKIDGEKDPEPLPMDTTCERIKESFRTHFVTAEELAWASRRTSIYLF